MSKTIETFYFLYKTTNLVNGKIYIGKHKTSRLNDGYMGSGKLLKHAINKYGKENFKFEILEFFTDEELLNKAEKELVTEDYCLRKDNYNLCVGGQGGFSYINRVTSKEDKHRQTSKMSQKRLNKISENPQWWIDVKHKVSSTRKSRFIDGTYQKVSHETVKQRIRNKFGVDNVMQLQEIKDKRSVTFALNKHSQGEKNSQFGTKWITNGIENRKISKSEEVPTGFSLGRKIKGS